MKMIRKLKPINLFPFLFAAYPVLALSSSNLIYVRYSSFIRSLIVVEVATILIFALCTLVTRNIGKGGLLATALLLVFFSYGHLYQIFDGILPGVFRHRYLIIVMMIILSGIFFLVFKAKSPPKLLLQYFTVTSILLFAFSAYPTIRNSIQTQIALNKAKKQQVAAINQSENMVKPDIYLIIVDSYTRADILKNIYGVDNSNFIKQLDQIGFYTAECSQSNYPSTRYSVSSIMQADYLQNVNPDGSLSPFSQTLVIKTLRSLGYSVYSFENRSKGHFDLGEDRQLSRQNPLFGQSLHASGLNEFEAELIKTTVLRIFIDMPQLVPFIDMNQAEYYEHYMQVKYTLNELTNMPDIKGPKLVFAHILVPHEPYIFTPDGDYQYTSLKDKKGYASNVAFVNSQLPSIFKQIIEKSEIPPIIIVQGDHGPNLSSGTPQIRHSIFNTYYVKDSAKELLYPTITPVNSFRVILSSYFGVNLDLLADKAYFAWGPNQLNEESIIKDNCSP